MFFGPEFLDLLREKIVLSDLIGRRVKLTHKGRESLGLCPFHKEKTPSFTVNDDKGFYHCFGCGAHGDAIRFLTECEKLPFMEAVELLAQMAGVPLPKPDKNELVRQKRQSDLADIMEIACQYFQSQLRSPLGKKACDYLKSRGLTGLTAKNFRLGYAPSGNGLLHIFQSKKIDLKVCQKLGLLAFNQQRQSWHDYFYDRVMFPIFDRKKRVIGFSGRMLEKGEPKYLNSPETDLFHKGEQLFGLPFAIDTIRRKNEAIVVEGNIDVISMHQAGWTQVVAPLGTAFTENQLQLLWHLCDEPIMCFDGDSAGQHAMIRALNRALPLLMPGKSLKFAVLPNGCDPDDMVHQNKLDEWTSIIHQAKSFLDVFWQNLLDTHLLKTPEQMAKFQQDYQNAIKQIKNLEVRGLYEKTLKTKFKDLTYQLQNPHHKITPKFNRITMPHTEHILLSYLYAYPTELSGYAEELGNLKLFDNINDIALFNAWLGAAFEGKQLELGDLDKTLLDRINKIRHNMTSHEVFESVGQIIKDTKIQSLSKIYAQKQSEYLKTEDPKIKEELDSLMQEIANFSNH